MHILHDELHQIANFLTSISETFGGIVFLGLGFNMIVFVVDGLILKEDFKFITLRLLGAGEFIVSFIYFFLVFDKINFSDIKEILFIVLWFSYTFYLLKGFLNQINKIATNMDEKQEWMLFHMDT